LSLIAIAANEIHSTDSIVTATNIDEFTCPARYSNTPIHDNPIIVKPVGKQTINRFLEFRLSAVSIKADIPIMNMETLLANTSEVKDGSKPRPLTNSSDRKKSWMNK
jgi:hypothetical protein